MTFVIERFRRPIPAACRSSGQTSDFSSCRLQGSKSSCVPSNIVESPFIGTISGAWLHRDWIQKSPIWLAENCSTDPNATRSLDVQREQVVFTHRLRKSGNAPLGIRFETNDDLWAQSPAWWQRTDHWLENELIQVGNASKLARNTLSRKIDNCDRSKFENLLESWLNSLDRDRNRWITADINCGSNWNWWRSVLNLKSKF